MWLICSFSVPKFFQDKPHIHYPLIKTTQVAFDESKALEESLNADVTIFSSKEGVKYFAEILKQLPTGKTIFCTGLSTKAAIESIYDGHILAPTCESQEGIINLLKIHKPKSLVYPHAKVIRPLLIDYIMNAGISCYDLVCYETKHVSADETLVHNIQGCFFGSSSQVASFKQNFPKKILSQIYVQGHVTKQAAEACFQIPVQILPFDNLKPIA